ncbi:asparagine synthase (glutamine-hydrolyzing) [Undibacterium sp. RuRC25W]|uniref:asparagine synthase (glutamine-hydrolyzing) n=1 Tax=Undibacterium sp. RuRC25W TaxID=3413047 RepID=UPI003BF13C1A
MCGLAGLIQTSGERAQLIQQVESMVRHLAHRGPDGIDVAYDTCCALGHSRLAMMDQKNGRQPYSDLTGRYWLVYNGEVYNYCSLRHELTTFHNHFESDCDTEVVLKSLITWGTDALRRFNGAFALAFYDRLERRLLLARDRYGKRPLFYVRQRDRLSFASEVKSFLGLQGFRFQFNPLGLSETFFAGALIGGETVFKDVQELQPGTVLEWKNDEVSFRQFARLPIAEKTYQGTYADACAELRQILGQATQLRHRTDKGLGLLLSGGLDSGIVAAETVTKSDGAKIAFSVGFEEARFDESSMQRLMAEHCGLSHQSLCVNEQTIAQALPQAVWHAETPLHCTAPVPMWLLGKAVKQAGISAVLTGEGADEAFLGYDLFKEVKLRLNPSADSFQHLYSLYQKWGATDLARVRLSVQRHDIAGHPLFSHLLRFSNNRLSTRLLRRPMTLDEYYDRWQQTQPTLIGLDPNQRARQIEYRLLLSGYLLSSQGDRMFAAHGIENRSPFLDNDVVDFALSLPDDWCLTSELQEKYILRDAYREHLPDTIIARAKQSYLSPDIQFVKSKSGKQLIDEYLNVDSLTDLDWLDSDYAALALERYRKTPSEQLSNADSQSVLMMLTTSILQRQFIHGDHPLTPVNLVISKREMTDVHI